jgi:electron transfer flavoprotein beta subunit
MKIAVLLKQVPDLVEDLEIADDGRSLDPDALKWRLSEFDDHALEEALLLKERGGAELTVIAAEGDEVDRILFTALAKGADRALKISGAGDEGGNLALAAAMAAILRGEAPDLVLTGVQAADDRDGQLGPAVAALLGLPCVEVVTGIALEPGRATLHKEYAGGVMAELEVDLPAVLGVQAARQPPRYAPVSKVRQVQQSARIEAVAAASAASAGLTVLEMTAPEKGQGAQMLESVDELLAVLESKGAIR